MHALFAVLWIKNGFDSVFNHICVVDMLYCNDEPHQIHRAQGSDKATTIKIKETS